MPSVLPSASLAESDDEEDDEGSFGDGDCGVVVVGVLTDDGDGTGAWTSSGKGPKQTTRIGSMVVRSCCGSEDDRGDDASSSLLLLLLPLPLPSPWKNSDGKGAAMVMGDGRSNVPFPLPSLPLPLLLRPGQPALLGVMGDGSMDSEPLL